MSNRCWTPDKKSIETCPVCSPALAASETGLRRLFKAEAQKHLFKPPPVKSPIPDPYLPGGLEEWEPGEEITRIDWRASVGLRGPMAAATPLLRQVLPDEPVETRKTIPSVEIYLDTSGSMKNPMAPGVHPKDCPMTIAALVVALSCLRAKGRVRGVVWSSGIPCVARTWMREEERVLKFFLQSIGGGTDFPFQEFGELAKESGPARGAFRVIVSDSDLLARSNWGGRYGGGIEPGNLRIIKEVAKVSERVVLILAGVDAETAKTYEAMAPGKISVAIVAGHEGLPKLAAGVADALFGRKQKK